MANEIDELMDKDPLKLSAQDIDKIIAYHHKAQAAWVPGKRAAKTEGEEKMKLDLSMLGFTKPPSDFKRRF